MRSTSLPRLLVIAAVSFAAAAGAGRSASAATQNRIQSAITNGSMVEVPNSVHPKVAQSTDLGPAPGEMKLQGMMLHFSRTAAQEEALDQLLVDLQNPASPRYQQWLTPAQFAAQFGVSSDDMAKVTAWLTSQGFTVTDVANGGSFVRFDGTVAQAQTAFATSIHSFSLNGEAHYANVTNPSLPGALANVVGGITGLHNFRLKPHVRSGTGNPLYYSSVSGASYLAPGDLYTIYNVTPLLTAGINGTGETIAVTGQVDISTTDIAAFRSASGLVAYSTSGPTLSTVHEGGNPGSPTCATDLCSPNDGDLAESSIDVEWSGAMAPNANLLFVNGPDVMFNAMTQAIDQNLAPIVTTSYGECEAGWGSNDINTLNAIFRQANAQGQTILASAGDAGATDCDAGYPALEGLTVDYPGSSPYVTSMGGTEFTNTSSYFGTSNGSTMGSALSYVPEEVWNEDSASNGIGAGGGGISNFFGKPAWQVETGPAGGPTTTVAPDASRDVPDIALDAAADSTDTPYLFCYLGSCVSGYRQSVNGGLTVAGGTSFDSEIFGGMLALIEQKNGGASARAGNINPRLYAFGNSVAFNNSTSTSVYHDVTVGSNKSPCQVGTPNCTSTAPIGYAAGPGYDLATGWGSVNLYNLASDWTLVTPLGVGSLGTGTASVVLSTASSSVSAGTSVTLTALINNYSLGIPTGTVQFLVNNVEVGSPVTLVSAGGAPTATYSLATSCSSLGAQNITVVYSGDANYASIKGPALYSGSAGNAGGAGVDGFGGIVTTPLVVNVTSGTCPDFTITPSLTTTTVNAGGTIPPVTITAAPVNSFTGTVVFTASVTSTTGYIPTVIFTPSAVSVGPSSSGTTSMTLSGITADLRMPNRPGTRDGGAMLAQNRPGRVPWKAAGSGVAVASMLLLVLPRRRRLGGLLMLALAAALIGGASGCSSSQSTVTTSSNPYVGTYYITVVGTYTSSSNQVTTHNQQVTYTIN